MMNILLKDNHDVLPTFSITRFFKRKSPCVQIILMEVVKNLDLKGMEVIWFTES